MNYTTWQETLEEANVPVEGDPLSVYRAFEQVADGRHKRGVRYSVALILTLIVLAKLAGMTTPLAIAEWVRLRAGWLRKVLPGTRESFPCASTYSNVLKALDAEQVNEVVMQVLTRARAVQRCGEEPSRLVGQAEREQQVHVARDSQDVAWDAGT
jgi:DDE_Tnp_1-associated